MTNEETGKTRTSLINKVSEIVENGDYTKIKKFVDKTITKYIENEIGIGELSETMSVLMTEVVLKNRNDILESDLLGIIDIASDAALQSRNYHYNPNSPHSFQVELQSYYRRIKDKQ